MPSPLPLKRIHSEMTGSTLSGPPGGDSFQEGFFGEEVWDLTRPLEKSMLLPGDPPVRIERTASLEKEGYRLSRLSLASHSGTHLDAPSHILPRGPGLDELPPNWMAGPARVILLPDPPKLGEEEAAALEVEAGEALLLKTSLGEVPRPAYHPATGPLVTPGGARAGVRLVGIDYPSIEPLERKTLDAHRILLGAGILVLEELDLRKIPPGRGFLYCFPLLFGGADGAPARVLFRSNPPPPRDNPAGVD